MSVISKKTVKQVLGELPFTAELYWRLLQEGQPLSDSASLDRMEAWLPGWRAQVEAARRARSQEGQTLPDGKRVMIFATLRYWIEHATLLGMALAGLGHEVRLVYLPYTNWRTPMTKFDLRRQALYMHTVLQGARPFVEPVSLLEQAPAEALPKSLEAHIAQVSLQDAQYTLQVEDIDRQGRLYRMRLERNRQAARAGLAWMKSYRPQVVITPNGSVMETGAIFHVAQRLGIPTVTYEFGEQRGRIWLAQNAQVMRQETGALWEARKDEPLREDQWEQARELFASRQRASLWENFSRRWQGLPSQGGERVRAALKLDRRPILLLAANVIGDSLTLDRQVFSDSMTQWLQRSVAHLADDPRRQLVVRVHPGERYTQGPSVADVVRRALPEMPPHIHLVEAQDQVNTYDLVEIADLGLVYTTTVGMEMAMSGVPVIVAGQTHYRGKGFTMDPDSWQAYFRLLDADLQGEQAPSLSRQQVERAWNYAYRFFFEYPQPFPWHLLYVREGLQEWPLERALSQEGLERFGDTYRCLVGELRRWSLS